MSKLRPAALLLCALLASCQGGGGDMLADAAGKPAPKDVKPAAPAAQAVQPAAAEPAPPANAAGSDEGRLVAAAESIAAIQAQKGNLAAFDVIFACYEKAKAEKMPIIESKICAAQDFVISKSVNDRTASPESADRNKRAKFIAKRSAERIGAVLQAKGMNQGQFNAFGRFLHDFVQPAYERRRTA